jgi:hypothetical protein
MEPVKQGGTLAEHHAMPERADDLTGVEAEP